MLNIFGLGFLVLIMIPNIVFAIRRKEGFGNTYSNKTIRILEQAGRYGCFSFMIFNIPGTWFGWWSDEAFALYLIGNTLMVALYMILRIVCRKKTGLFRTLALSMIPSLVFLFSGIMSRSVLLIASALLFAPAHICISCGNCRKQSAGGH